MEQINASAACHGSTWALGLIGAEQGPCAVQGVGGVHLSHGSHWALHAQRIHAAGPQLAPVPVSFSHHHPGCLFGLYLSCGHPTHLLCLSGEGGICQPQERKLNSNSVPFDQPLPRGNHPSHFPVGLVKGHA